MREEAMLCARGEQQRCCAWAGAAACVWRRWEQANVGVDERGEMDDGRRERDLERRDGGRRVCVRWVLVEREVMTDERQMRERG
ncbi:hypothetical protein MRB53_030426 [Persea americana]|uniref:Uncharacterized protein n=1 Tax=Persea americana TaxID=3435 RepID=A0ACC2KLA8_PERAE|nr:hypothetical protein MRB53_030426 [Persea americana]